MKDFYKKIKSFLVYTIPFIIEYMFLQSTDFVDTTLSSRVNYSTIVGISTMVLIIAVIKIFSKVMSTTNEIIISRIYGKDKDSDNINKVTYNSLVLCFVINAFLCLLTFVFSNQLINFMGFNDGNAFNIAKTYLTVRLISCLLAPFQQVIQSKLKVIDKSKKVMQAKIIYTILNIIGDTLGVTLGYGALGIAVSTVICEIIEIIILLIYNKGIQIRKIEKNTLKEIFSIYKINIFSKLGHRVGVVVFTSIASNLGENLYANYAMALQVMYLGVSVSEALGEATLIQIGQTLHSNNKDEINSVRKTSKYCSYILVVIVAVSFIILARPLISLVSNGTFEEFAIYLIYIFIFEVTFGILQSPLEGYLLACKEVKYVTFVNLEGILIVRILSALLLLKLGIGIYGIAISLVIDYIYRYSRYYFKCKNYEFSKSNN